jgi:hypothetical protein
MREADLPPLRWHKSSHSSANGQCVEVASVAGAVAVRDSKNPAGPGLVFTRQAWAAFLESVKLAPAAGAARSGQASGADGASGAGGAGRGPR